MCAAAAVPRPARAEIGIGIFIGEPLGGTLKIDIAQKMAVEVLAGATTFRRGRSGYAHVTLLVQPFIVHGGSVLVPLRLGVGAALYDWGHDIDLALRAPLEVGFRFVGTPLELYVELALALVVLDERDDVWLDLQGGVGLRVYF